MVRLHAVPFNISYIQVYAPAANSTDTEAEEFYIRLQETVDKCDNQDVVMVAGDFNTKVGQERSKWQLRPGSNE